MLGLEGARASNLTSNTSRNSRATSNGPSSSPLPHYAHHNEPGGGASVTLDMSEDGSMTMGASSTFSNAMYGMPPGASDWGSTVAVAMLPPTPAVSCFYFVWAVLGGGIACFGGVEGMGTGR